MLQLETWVLLASAIARPADAPMIPAFFTGERLYEICVSSEQTLRWMYVAGVLDGVFEAEAGSGARTICRVQITNREAAERVTKYLRENNEIRRKAAAVAVSLALEPELACTPDEA